jgi:hypothetical protein
MNYTRPQLKNSSAGPRGRGGPAGACALALGSLVDSPEQLFNGAPQDVQSRPPLRARSLPGLSSSRIRQKARLGDRLRRFFFAQRHLQRGALLLPPGRSERRCSRCLARC